MHRNTLASYLRDKNPHRHQKTDEAIVVLGTLRVEPEIQFVEQYIYRRDVVTQHQKLCGEPLIDARECRAQTFAAPGTGYTAQGILEHLGLDIELLQPQAAIRKEEFEVQMRCSVVLLEKLAYGTDCAPLLRSKGRLIVLDN